MVSTEGSPRIDAARLATMVFDAAALARLPRDTLICVFMGDLVDPTGVSEWHYGRFISFDPAELEVTYMVIEPPKRRRQKPSNVRGMVVDQSGLLLPEGTYYTVPEPEQNRVRLDEAYFIVDGEKYERYVAAASQRPDDDLY